mgnify:CR=1 FL=1
MPKKKKKKKNKKKVRKKSLKKRKIKELLKRNLKGIIEKLNIKPGQKKKIQAKKFIKQNQSGLRMHW